MKGYPFGSSWQYVRLFSLSLCAAAAPSVVAAAAGFAAPEGCVMDTSTTDMPDSSASRMSQGPQSPPKHHRPRPDYYYIILPYTRILWATTSIGKACSCGMILGSKIGHPQKSAYFQEHNLALHMHSCAVSPAGSHAITPRDASICYCSCIVATRCKRPLRSQMPLWLQGRAISKHGGSLPRAWINLIERQEVSSKLSSSNVFGSPWISPSTRHCAHTASSVFLQAATVNHSATFELPLL
jgi:hypothetical protein